MKYEQIVQLDEEGAFQIIKVTGPRANLSQFEQKKLIKEDLRDLLKKLKELSGAKVSIKYKTVNFTLSEKDELSINIKKQKLKEAKAELIAQKEEILSSINSDEVQEEQTKDKIKQLKR